MADNSVRQSLDHAASGRSAALLAGAAPQLAIILSWRLAAELWRRYPKAFDLFETHPCDGQYDCLSLRSKGADASRAIDINRGGSVHVHAGGDAVYADWMARMLSPRPEVLLDDIADAAGLVPPKKLPASTPTTLTYRYMADFLAPTFGRLEKWDCRNGLLDTSEHGGGVRRQLFEAFPILSEPGALRDSEPILGQPASSFWFLLKHDSPVQCLDTHGRVYRRDGGRHDLPNLYEGDRRIWPLIAATALDVLP